MVKYVLRRQLFFACCHVSLGRFSGFSRADQVEASRHPLQVGETDRSNKAWLTCVLTSPRGQRAHSRHFCNRKDAVLNARRTYTHSYSQTLHPWCAKSDHDPYAPWNPRGDGRLRRGHTYQYAHVEQNGKEHIEYRVLKAPPRQRKCRAFEATLH